jgi:predicted secreted protein
MATDARIGLGTEFWLEDTAGGTLTNLGEILSVPSPAITVDEVEATHMASPGGYREYIAGLKDGGSGDITMNYVPGSATDVIIRAALTDREARGYKIVIPDGATGWEVTGDLVVLGYSKDIPIDDRMVATVSVRFSGEPTEAAGA